jgi:hypothetical protein
MTKNKTQQKTVKSPWEGLKPKPIILGHIRLDEKLQIRDRVDPATANRYANVLKSGKDMPPIKVGIVKGVPYLIDGWHRLEAMRLLGWAEAEALVIDTNRSNARWLAASANLEHGKPLKTREIKEVFRAFVKANKHRKSSGQLLSYRDIGAVIGVSYGTIRNWMIKHFPTTAKEYSGESPDEEDFHGEGGCHDVVQKSDVREWTVRALADVLHEYHSCEDRDDKEVIRTEFRKALTALEDERHWEPKPF